MYAGSIGDGLFKINLKSFNITQFTEKEGLPTMSINTIFKDSKNNVWLGSSDGGLVKIDGFDKNGKLTILKTYATKVNWARSLPTWFLALMKIKPEISGRRHLQGLVNYWQIIPSIIFIQKTDSQIRICIPY